MGRFMMCLCLCGGDVCTEYKFCLHLHLCLYRFFVCVCLCAHLHVVDDLIGIEEKGFL